jgi:hypothetical protein
MVAGVFKRELPDGSILVLDCNENRVYRKNIGEKRITILELHRALVELNRQADEAGHFDKLSVPSEKPREGDEVFDYTESCKDGFKVT